MNRRAFLPVAPGALLLAQEGGKVARGRLSEVSGEPALKTAQGTLIFPQGDGPTEGVLHDSRLLGEDMELVGRFDAPDRFTVDPIHLRAIFVYRNGKRLAVTYWCDVCALRFYTPGKCWCCQEETKLDLIEPTMSNTGNYSAARALVDGVEAIRLKDAARKTEVSIVPTIGHNAYEMKVDGKSILWSPYKTLKELVEKPAQVGNPFLSPWINRIDGDAYWANGKKYLLNPELKNYRYDAFHHPIHGLVVYAKEWKVVSLWADEKSALVVSRLEFWRRADWMAQFPFAHTVEMTYRLKNGIVEVETAIENLSLEPMPLSLGFHTYYRLDDSPRDDWTVHVPAKEHVILSKELLPTGEREPVALADPQPLRDFQLDDVFTNLVRDQHGRAEFWVRGKGQRINVAFGPKYNVGVAYAPPGRDFVCFEPMVGITNAFNLAQTGVYKEMQYVAPGGTWRESFWIKPEGY